MKTIRTIAGLAVVCVAFAFAMGQNAARPQDPLDFTPPGFEVKDETLVEAVSELSRQSIEGLHIGVEEVLRETAAAPPPKNPQFSLSLHGKTVREILNNLCAHDKRYIWMQDGMTINIYPKAVSDDGSYLLNRKLERITVTDIDDPGAALTFLDKQLPPPREQLGYAGTGGDSSYSSPWTQTFDRLTVRQFINRLSEHMGPHTSWVWYGSKEERLFTFLKGGFH